MCCEEMKRAKACNPQDGLLNEAYKKVSVLQEMYLEFFATLIPGFVLTSCSLVFGAVLFRFFEGKWIWTYDSIMTLNNWLVAIFIMVMSYVTGAVLYRKEPNIPDAISALRQWVLASDNERRRLAVQFSIEGCMKSDCFFHRILFLVSPEFFAKKYKISTNYPYRYLRQYLLKRGMTHLLEFIPWCEHCQQNNQLSQRSKVTINALKSIIKEYGNGNLILDLLRNEGHIRMLTSLWYVMKYLRWLTIIIVVELIFATWGYGLERVYDERYYSWYFIFFMGAYIFTLWGKRGIESTIHYVRSREIVTVLEQAYLIKIKMGKENPIWTDISQRNEQFCEKTRENNTCKEKCPDFYKLCVNRQLTTQSENTKSESIAVS